jgi:hypothetical protein
MTLDSLVCTAFKPGNAVIHAECGDSTLCQASLGLLYKTFQDSVITQKYPEDHHCGNSLPACSPKVGPCDNFLWGFMPQGTL